jgi:hypothetical protein
MPIQSANKPELLTVEKWAGLNQQARRGSIDDQEEWWNENLYALGPGNLRSCWGPSAAIYTVPTGYVIRRIFFGFYGGGPDGPTPFFGAPPPGRLCWVFRSPTDPTNQAGYVDEVDLDSGHVTVVGQIWTAISPQWWGSAKVWRPQFIGRADITTLGTGQQGGVLFGSPKGLYAWSNPTGQTGGTAAGFGLFSPGDNAPDWLTDAAETLSPVVPMPIGLPGIYTMEVYGERLWVGGKDVVSFSAPSNGADFSTVDGGGSFGFFGDNLVYSWMDFSHSAGYLYLFGDSSTWLISNVTLTGSGTPAAPYTTIFNYQNIDPIVGHRFPRQVGTWGRYKTMYNGAGIYLMFGGDAQVIGEKVTNLYLTLDTSQYYPTMAEATFFGFRHLLCNGRFTDPYGITRSLILAWNGGFWTVMSQHYELTHIGTYEQDSILTAYGTDGTYLYRLFDHPDNTLNKRLATKAFRGTGLSQLTIKQFKRIFMEVHDHSGLGVSFNGTSQTTGGGIPAGNQDVSFQLASGEIHDVLPHAINGSGLDCSIDLQSKSPDFTIERLHLTAEERTLYGA